MPNRDGYFCDVCDHKKIASSLIGSKFCLYCRRSTRNKVYIFISESIALRESLKILKKSSKFKRFAIKSVIGWFSSHKYEHGVEMERVFNKERDEYHEIVKDYKTKKVIHEDHGKLSEHIGHGSAKFNK